MAQPNANDACAQTWIAGKWLSPRQQLWAPAGTHFRQFVVPPILRFRRDCTYGELAAMRLPDDVQGLGVCEVSKTGRGGAATADQLPPRVLC